MTSPGKSLFGTDTSSTDKLERTRADIQSYIQAVLKDEILCYSEQLFEFLSLSEGSVQLPFVRGPSIFRWKPVWLEA
jgi:hypothetical protein